MRKLVLFCLLSLLLFAIPQAKAIITDPEDCVIYDSGILAQSDRDFWKTDSVRIILTPGITLESSAGVGCSKRKEGHFNGSNEVNHLDLTYEALGFSPKMSFTEAHDDTEIGALVIGRRSEDAATGEKFSISSEEYLSASPEIAALPWNTRSDKDSYTLTRPSDSVIIRVPKTCDSVFVQTNWCGGVFGMMVYEVGVGKVVAPAERNGLNMYGSHGTYRTNVYYTGYNDGFVLSIGFKPQHLSPGDSTDIVILGVNKDAYNDNKANNKRPFENGGSCGRTQIFIGETVTDEDGTVRERYLPGNAWPGWSSTMINRIKIYGKIDNSDIPEFDGTHSGFTFSYQPRESGTVLLDKPLKPENGWSGTAFPRYASDLGVVRSVMSASTSFYLGFDEVYHTHAAKLSVMKSTDPAVDYENLTSQEGKLSYYNITTPTTGFQDMSLEFDYALKGVNDTVPVIVAAYINGDTTCVVLDTLVNSANPTEVLAHAVVPIPNDFANEKHLAIRLMVGKGALTATIADFYLANLKLKGYRDFNPSHENAAKVAYLTPAVDRIHVLELSETADSADVILPYLFKNEDFNVNVVAKDVWSGFASASEEEILVAFKDYDVVVASPYMTAADLSFAQALIGKKAFLNFNAEAFSAWEAGAGISTTPNTTMTFAEEFFYHPVLAGLDLKKDSAFMPSLFDAAVSGVNVADGENAYILVSGHESGAAIVYEDCCNPAAKYVFMDMPAETSNSLSDEGERVLSNIISYLQKNGNFVRPTFELIATGAVVENSAQLALAANYDYGVLNLTTPVIEMRTSTDADGVYTIGESFCFGKNDITFQPDAASSHVVISGVMANADVLDVNCLSFKNITFNPLGGQSAVIALKDGDRLLDELSFEQCTFEGLKGKLVDLAGDNITLKNITLNNCLLEDIDVSALISLDGEGILCQKVNVKENRFYDSSLSALIDWKAQVTKELDEDEEDGDEVLSINVSNNTFRNRAVASAATSLVSMKKVQFFDSVSVVVNNNLLYNVGNVNVDLFAAPSEIVYGEGDVVTFKPALDLRKNFVEASSFALNIAEGGAIEWNSIPFDLLTKESLGLTGIFEDEAQTQISKLSEMYVGGVISGLDCAYIGAYANYIDRNPNVARLVKVSSAPELKTALELAVGGDIIELENNVDDPLGVYQMGNTGFTYPSDGGKLIIRAAEGHTPVLFGNLAPSNAGLNLDTLCIDGLTWSDVTVADANRITGYDAESYAPFYFSGTNGYLGLLHVTNSVFKNLQKQQVIRTNKCYDEVTKTGLFIGKIVMDYNEFDNHGGALEDGQTGGHFIQFDVKGTYTVNNFIFVENVLKNFHGSQLFNISREGALDSADSTINIVIGNNIFYKVGGNSKDQYRNFLEFSKNPVGFEVNIDITNNIFWKRWSEVNHPLGQLALFDGTQVKSYKINVLKNYFEGEYYESEETFGANPMAPKESVSSRDRNLALSSTSVVEVNRDAALDWESFADYIELDESTEDFTANISQEYEVFTAGEAHPYNAGYRYIGTAAGYGLEPIRDESGEVSIEKVEGIGFTAFASGGELYINLAEKAEVIICHVSGKRVSGQTLNAGLNELSGLNNGMYIVNVNGHNAKVLVK